MRVRYDFDHDGYRLTGDSTSTHDIDILFTDDEAHQLVHSFIRAGVDVDYSRDSYIKGKLEATESHLADMRRLVMLENEKGEV